MTPRTVRPRSSLHKTMYVGRVQGGNSNVANKNTKTRHGQRVLVLGGVCVCCLENQAPEYGDDCKWEVLRTADSKTKH